MSSVGDQSLKKDAGKLRLDLVPPEWIKGLAQVLQMGAEKYEDNGWRNRVMERDRMYAALQRHLLDRRLGVVFDDESGLDHQMPMPKVPHPDQLPGEAEIRQKILPQLPEAVRRYYERVRPIELKPVDFGRYGGKAQPGNQFNIWMRTTARLPDDPAIHRCALAYASDMTILDTALLPHGRSIFDRDIMGASLDHAVWFHRPFRADQWLLYNQDSPSSHGSRGFGRGLIFAADGTLVASIAQEGLMRNRRPEAIQP